MPSFSLGFSFMYYFSLCNNKYVRVRVKNIQTFVWDFIDVLFLTLCYNTCTRYVLGWNNIQALVWNFIYVLLFSL